MWQQQQQQEHHHHHHHHPRISWRHKSQTKLQGRREIRQILRYFLNRATFPFSKGRIFIAPFCTFLT